MNTRNEVTPSPDPTRAISLRFAAGTLEVRSGDSGDPPRLPGCLWDERSACLRAPAYAYAAIVLALQRQKLACTDEARAYATLEHGLEIRRTPRPYQQEALDAWNRGGGRGVVVLPTGAGKTHVALMAIDAKRRSALVVAPTLDLVAQWVTVLKASFRIEVGVIGGGEYRLGPLTVITYDSALIHMENLGLTDGGPRWARGPGTRAHTRAVRHPSHPPHELSGGSCEGCLTLSGPTTVTGHRGPPTMRLGSRFGMIIFDECHHLPGESYRIAAEASLAPYRLGLTATPPDRVDARAILDELIGSVAYRKDISELSGEYLADYSVETILVDLTAEERRAYEAARAVYRDFVRSHGISMSRADGWSRFVIESSMSAEGRRAMQAYLEQRHLAFAAPSKLAFVAHLLHRHRRDQVLLFTDRNSTAYELSSRLLVPAITHQTSVSERLEILEGFSQARYNAIATSRVLNEGIDLPSANVGIVISGSGSVREHVQRLGRILRKVEGKQAVLYELVANDTAEMYTSTRRREHDAYS